MKYGNRKTYVDDIRFDSLAEARYYIYLRDRLRKGEIADLRLQVRFELVPAVYKTEEIQLKTKIKTVKKCVQQAICYIADFVYLEDGKEVVVDVKSAATADNDVYKLKKKLMLALLGIEITEVVNGK